MKRSNLTKEFETGLKHFYDCIDFGKCNLDAEAIRFMNEIPGRLVNSHKALVEFAQNFFEWHANHFEDFSDEINGQLLCIANDAEVAIAKDENT